MAERKRRSGVSAGPRVYLRAPVARDRDEFLELNRKSTRLFRGLASPMVSPRAFSAYVTRSTTAEFAGMLICREVDDAIVGCVNLGQIVRGVFQSAYMGYQIFAPFAGQGYMTAAMPLVLRLAFRTLKLHRVEANIQPGNLPSLATVRRAGFHREGYSPRYLKIAGRWRDHERWTMTVEDWREQQGRARAKSPGRAGKPWHKTRDRS